MDSLNPVGADETSADSTGKIVMYWLRAQRDRSIAHDYFLDRIVRHCQEGARQAGMDLRIISPDDVIVAGSPNSADVWVSGTRVVPTACFFHTKLMTWPDSVGDTWRMLSVGAALDAAGFHTTVPATVNIASNDKLVTMFQHAVPDVEWLPTLRITTRQFGWLAIDELGMDYPVIVKPASWGGGFGVMRAANRRELEAVLQLAGAGEVTMVIQPWLGEGVVDYRVYCVDGVAYKAMTRAPQPGVLVGNVQQGGGPSHIIEVPEELRVPAEQIAGTLGLAYTCVDFLRQGDRYWFSELEVDGGTSLSPDLTNAKFGAYRRQFERFVGARLDPTA